METVKEYKTIPEMLLGIGRLPKEGVPEIKIRYNRSTRRKFLGKISSSYDVAKFIRSIYRRGEIELQEQFIILYLDNAHNILGYYRHAKGALNATVADIRIILGTALKSASSSIILAHNHPSGNLKPSSSDINLTEKYKGAAQKMDIQVLDHLIVTKDSYYSFLDDGLLGISGLTGRNGDKTKSQFEINKDIEALVMRLDKEQRAYTADEYYLMKQYEGSGGLSSKGAKGEGILHEFYTPQYICDLMWDLARHYGYEEGTVLEPSCGTGRFIEGANSPEDVVGFEINPISARIAELLNTDSNDFITPRIYNQHFETAFLDEPRFTSRLPKNKTWLKEYPFSLVIGNPPYGKNKNLYSSYFKNPKFPQVDTFFMYHSLQLLKKGGLLVFISASNFMRNGNTYNESKNKIAEIADFVDAIRLPKVFSNTSIPTDILIFRRK